MRADKIRAGDVLPGFPNRTVTAVDRIDKPGWPKPWVRITTGPADPIGIAFYDYPPDWPVDTYRDDDGEAAT